MRRVLTLSLALSGLLSLFLMFAGPSAPAAQAAGKQIVGYFGSWDVYDRNYFIKNIATSGSASKLTVLN